MRSYLNKASTTANTLAGGRCVRLFTLTPASLGPTFPFTLPLGPTSVSQQQLSEYSDEEIICFCHDAGLALYQVITDFDPASSTTPNKITVVSLARLNAWNVSVIDLLCEKECRGGRRRKEYSDTCRKFLRLATTQLVGAVG